MNLIVTSSFAELSSNVVEAVSAKLSIVVVAASSFHIIYILIVLVLGVVDKGIFSIIVSLYVAKFTVLPPSIEYPVDTISLTALSSFGETSISYLKDTSTFV